MHFTKDRRVRFHLLSALIVGILLGVGTFPGSQIQKPGQPEASADASGKPNFGQLSLSFEPNVGQTNQAARYLAHAPVGVLYFTPSEVVVSLKPPLAVGDQGSGIRDQYTNLDPLPSDGVAGQAQGATSALRISHVGASQTATLRSGGLLPGKVNYFLGNDPTKWYTNLPTYNSVTYAGLYPGIDLLYSGNGMQLEGTYTLAPGADPSQIRWRYEGADTVTASADGNLQITIANSKLKTMPSNAVKGQNPKLIEQAPVAWQDLNGRRVPVTARYDVLADNTVGFTLGAYDHASPLIIDPTLVYSTYLGGTGDDYTTAMEIDPGPNKAYVTGYTQSLDFPTTNVVQPFYAGGSTDVFVARFNPDGTALDYATYLGGSGEDIAHAIHIGGGLMIAGETRSTDFPTRLPYQSTLHGDSDAFVTVFDGSGTGIFYSSYFGGSGEDVAYGVGDSANVAAVITGKTNSTDLPMVGAYQPQYGGGASDAYLAGLDITQPALLLSTYLGGSQEDVGYGIALSGASESYITGVTFSSNFPLVNPYQPNYGGNGDAFITAIQSWGSPEFSSYLGGSGFDAAYGSGGSGSAFIYMAGVTGSPNFPVVNPVQPQYGGGPSDAFVAHVASNGRSLIFSTFLGGSGEDVGTSLAVDLAHGDVTTAGWTHSPNFPVANAIQSQPGGDKDAFVSQLPPSGQPLYLSTYLGGSGPDVALAAGTNYQYGDAFLAGYSQSDDFPVTGNVMQSARMGGVDAIVARISSSALTSTPTPTGTPPTATGTRTPRLTPTSTATATPSTTPACGSVWSLATPMPTASTYYDNLLGVAAISADDAWVVGYSIVVGGNDQPIIEHWNGSQWSLVSSPYLGPETKLFAVAAVSSNDVWAAGQYYTNTDNYTLIEHWDGTQWTQIPSPPPSGSDYAALNSIAVVAPDDIWAVGYWTEINRTTTHPLVVHWNGTQWSVVPSPSPGSWGNTLSAVSAASANDIWAVGSYGNVSYANQTLIIHWDGSQWSQAPSVEGGTATSSALSGVTAIASNDAWAVGVYGGLTLVEHWNGTTWSLVGAANPGLYANQFSDVLALSGNDVWAVGSYNTNNERTLVEHWDGSRWTQVASPNVAGATSNSLTALATTQSGVLFAAGHYTSPGNSSFRPFAERYADSDVPCPNSTLVGHVTWQGHPAQPNTLQQLPITLTLKLGTTEINYPTQTTDASGFFTTTISGLAPGTYHWRVKGPKFLANSGTVELNGFKVQSPKSKVGRKGFGLWTLDFEPSTTNVEMGLMRAGDADNDNTVNVGDFNILKLTFGKTVGDPGYDDRADFTGEQWVNISDFNLLKVNFGQGGAPPIRSGLR